MNGMVWVNPLLSGEEPCTLAGLMCSVILHSRVRVLVCNPGCPDIRWVGSL